MKKDSVTEEENWPWWKTILAAVFIFAALWFIAVCILSFGPPPSY